MGKIPLSAGRHKCCTERSTTGFNVEERGDLSRQVEAMPADQAVVICQYMAIQFFAELGANGTTTYTATESAK